jgi:transitional endoplasmic reticulum ATPase
MATVVGWQGGVTTTGSATPIVVPPPHESAAVELPGLEKQVAALTEWLDLGFHRKDLLAKLGTKPQLGVLVSGPAGSGKAAIVEAVAGAMRARLLRAWGPRLAGLEPNAAAQELTALINDGTRNAPAVLLVEDVDAIAPREGAAPLTTWVLTAFREAAAAGRLAIVCTTSRPEAVTPELRAPGTLDHELTVPLPDRATRLRVLQHAVQHVPVAEDVQLDDVAGRTPGFVAADLLALVREAGLRAASRQTGTDQPSLAAQDFSAALEVVRPTSLGGARLDVAQVSLDDVGDMAEV